jgi:hypothetical protein
MPTDTITELFAGVASIDWNHLGAVTAASDKVLTALDAHRGELRELAERAIGNPDLLPLCEHYDILDKIVLHNNPTGWRLRLHVFLTDDQLCNSDDINVAELQARMVRTESSGDFYTLHHNMIHSVTAEPYTTSLIVRGPAVKDRFLVTDRVTGQAWWQYGAITESCDDAARKRMNTSQANASLQQLIEREILP